LEPTEVQPVPNFDPLAKFHHAVIAVAIEKLGRELTEPEHRFVMSRGGYLAFEMIYDTVRSESSANVEGYLNIERE